LRFFFFFFKKKCSSIILGTKAHNNEALGQKATKQPHHIRELNIRSNHDKSEKDSKKIDAEKLG